MNWNLLVSSQCIYIQLSLLHKPYHLNHNTNLSMFQAQWLLFNSPNQSLFMKSLNGSLFIHTGLQLNQSGRNITVAVRVVFIQLPNKVNGMTVCFVMTEWIVPIDILVTIFHLTACIVRKPSLSLWISHLTMVVEWISKNSMVTSSTTLCTQLSKKMFERIPFL